MVKIAISPLNGANYVVWKNSASLYLCIKSKLRKLENINGKVQALSKEDPKYYDWESNENSMDPNIADGFLFLDSPKEFWNRWLISTANAMWDEQAQHMPLTPDLDMLK
ncbi:hypothetical protein EJ110_NYTH52317 [Nymphaea thermarum]|nr:hypothetical protein EJ110_NYTH52317 [Nymphaea thermarum]